MHRAVGVLVVLLALSGTVAGCSSGSHPHADPISGITCPSDRFGRVSVDHSGTTGDSSPLVAVASYVSSAGSALPAEGYTIDNSFGADHTTQEAPSSQISPGATSPPPTTSLPTQTIVHRSDQGVDVAITVVDFGAGWQVTNATYCPEATH